MIEAEPVYPSLGKYPIGVVEPFIVPKKLFNPGCKLFDLGFLGTDYMQIVHQSSSASMSPNLNLLSSRIGMLSIDRRSRLFIRLWLSRFSHSTIAALVASLRTRLLVFSSIVERLIPSTINLPRLAAQMYNGSALAFDQAGRVRLDDREMQPDVQRQVGEIWPWVGTENLQKLTDIDGYRAEFLKLFGFGLAGVDYEADVEPHVTMS